MTLRRFAPAALVALGAIALAGGPLAGAAEAPDASTPLFERNLSATPSLRTDQAKIELLQMIVPARDADGHSVTVPLRDSAGTVVEQRTDAKPLVAVYQDEQPGTGADDVHVASSLDDGDTWTRTNLSRSAGRSSFTLAGGTPFPGGVEKPAITQKGNRVLIAWTSTYCAGGSPRYEADAQGDVWGVGGAQGSKDYTSLGYPQVGERPYECVWTARGVADPATGQIAWRSPERLTSGVRNAMQLMINSASGAGFALAWAEDPEGVRPGEGDGPGSGWSGANPNDGTDIWFSTISMGDFDAVDPASDPSEPAPAKRMSMPIPISDNAPRTPADVPESQAGRLCADTHAGQCVSADHRLLDGATGATRPNLMLSPYTFTKPDGSTGSSAWVVLGYEETKGLGDESGDGDSAGAAPVGAAGKNIVAHAFDFRSPDVVAGGTVINPQMRDASGAPLWVVRDGRAVLDWKGDRIPARENARRVRFLVQPKAQMGPSRTIGVALYRMGERSDAAPADVVMQRFVVPATDTATDDPFRPANLTLEVVNLSGVTPLERTTDPIDGSSRVTRWTQTAANLGDRTSAFAQDDGRAHRGFLKGDFLAVGYDWTPDWAAYMAGRDVENYYVRRSFDGGATFTTTPAALGGTGRRSCLHFHDGVSGRTIEPECRQLGAGEFEPAQDLSRLDGPGETVIEPRLVGLPGTIPGSPYPEDQQDTSVVWQAWGTSEPQGTGDVEDGDAEVPFGDAGPQPLDLRFTFSQDYGDTYAATSMLAGGPAAQGGAQLRPTADGSRAYVVWDELGPGDLDAWFRRITPAAFPYNTGPGTIAFSTPAVEVREGDDIALDLRRLVGSRGAVAARAVSDSSSALGGEDFQPLDDVVRFTQGQRRADVVLHTVQDQAAEPTEELRVRLVDADGGASVGTPAEVVVRIVDDDQPAPGGPAPASGQSGPAGGPARRLPMLDALHVWPSRFRAGGVPVRISARIAERARLLVTVRRPDHRLVRVLRKGFHDAGTVRLTWNGRTRSGRLLAPGAYVVSAQAFNPAGDPGNVVRRWVRVVAAPSRARAAL